MPDIDTATNPMAALNPYLMLGAGVSSFLQASSAEEEANAKWRYTQQQKQEIEKQRGQLDEVYGLQLGMAGETFQQQTGELSYGAGQSLYDITTQGGTAELQQNLVHGSAQKITGQSREKARQGWRFGQEKVTDVYGQKLLDIESGYQGEVGRLDSELAKLDYESRMYKSQMGTTAFMTNFLSGVV